MQLMVDNMHDNKETFEENSKHNWVYNTTHLLDFQKIAWSPYKTEDYKYKAKMFSYLDNVDSVIYLKVGEFNCEEVTFAVVKGEVKWASNDIGGNLKLKAYSFISLKLSKFTGVITFLHDLENIWAANLIIRKETFDSLNKDIQTKITKVCHGKNWGHSDIHIIREMEESQA